MDVAFIYDDYEGKAFSWNLPFLPASGDEIFVGDFDPELIALEDTSESIDYAIDNLGINPTDIYHIDHICWQTSYINQEKPGVIAVIYLKD
jgi:hypothetical protein